MAELTVLYKYLGLSLSKKAMLKYAEKGRSMYGKPSQDGREIESLYIAGKPQDTKDMLLVRFMKEGGRSVFYDLQLRQKLDDGVREIHGDREFLVIWYYGPKVERMAC